MIDQCLILNKMYLQKKILRPPIDTKFSRWKEVEVLYRDLRLAICLIALYSALEWSFA